MDYKDKLLSIPKKPGCYQYKDASGQIIYVGKAKNLYNRIRSYFIGSHDAKTTKLVSNIADFEYIITSSETEAFILEMNLIKKYNPKYNILLTDDKKYPYICITNETHPRILYVRDTSKSNRKIFGPYPNTVAAKEVVELLNRIYGFRKCNKIPKKECLYYHLHRCIGPCINNINQDAYKEMLANVINILKGNVKEEIKNIKGLMEQASNNLDFEKAIEYRNLVEYLNTISEHQKMEGFIENSDIFGYFVNEDYLSIQVFHLREGKLLERNGYLFNNDNSVSDVFTEFIVQFYLVNNNPIPNSILISDGDAELLTNVLNVKVEIPKKGKKHEMVKLVIENAKQKVDELIKKETLKYNQEEGALKNIEKLLGLKDLHVIEAFDNSNILGVDPVSAMVCFVDGKPQKKNYRKYKIKTVVGANEAKTMREVIIRRYSKLENNPDLIIMDGGPIQVNSALNALKEISRDIKVLGLIKDNNHKTRSLYFEGKEINIAPRSHEFHLLERIQEEVHRYAITYFRTNHSKQVFLSSLDSIKGIGKVKKNQILKLLKEENFSERLKTLKLTPEQIEEVLKLLDK